MLELEDKIKNIIFVSEGGIGRVIASTAVVAQVKKRFPDKNIVVVSGCLDVFANNPHVYRAFNFHNPLYFYDDWVKEDSYIMHVEPYRHRDYLFGNLHMIDAWCDLIGIPRPEDKRPEMYFLKKELEAAGIFADKTTEKKKKKLAIFQWVGGIVPEDKSPEKLLDSLAKMHKRSLSQTTAQQVVNSLIARDYAVVTPQADNFPQLAEVKECRAGIRNIIALLHHADAFIGIDSFAQHAAVAMKKRGVVVWGGTNPKRLGYDFHLNLNKVVDEDIGCKMPNCHRPNSYIFDMNPSGFVWNCPYDEVCMVYTVEEIMSAFDSIYKTKPPSKPEEAKELAGAAGGAKT